MCVGYNDGLLKSYGAGWHSEYLPTALRDHPPPFNTNFRQHLSTAQWATATQPALERLAQTINALVDLAVLQNSHIPPRIRDVVGSSCNRTIIAPRWEADHRRHMCSRALPLLHIAHGFPQTGPTGQGLAGLNNRRHHHGRRVLHVWARGWDATRSSPLRARHWSLDATHSEKQIVRQLGSGQGPSAVGNIRFPFRFTFVERVAHAKVVQLRGTQANQTRAHRRRPHRY